MYRYASRLFIVMCALFVVIPSRANTAVPGAVVDENAEFERLLGLTVSKQSSVETDGVFVGVRIATVIESVKLVSDCVRHDEVPRLEFGNIRFLFLTGSPLRVRMQRQDTGEVLFDEVLLVPPFQPFRAAAFWTDGTVPLGACSPGQRSAPVVFRLAVVEGANAERVILERVRRFDWKQSDPLPQVAEPDVQPADEQLGDAIGLQLAAVGDDPGILVRWPQELLIKHHVRELDGSVDCDGTIVARFRCSVPTTERGGLSWLARGATDPGVAPVRLQLIGDRDVGRRALLMGRNITVTIRGDPTGPDRCSPDNRGWRGLIRKAVAPLAP